jgi:NAD(P)-dependent dehydrogenase (short-subunit alcohol dehydrogenase family)
MKAASSSDHSIHIVIFLLSFMARNKERAQEAALAAVLGAETVAVGDVASISQTRGVAEQINRLGSFDAVIHNVGVGYREPRKDRDAETNL